PRLASLSLHDALPILARIDKVLPLSRNHRENDRLPPGCIWIAQCRQGDVDSTSAGWLAREDESSRLPCNGVHSCKIPPGYLAPTDRKRTRLNSSHDQN